MRESGVTSKSAVMISHRAVRPVIVVLTLKSFNCYYDRSNCSKGSFVARLLLRKTGMGDRDPSVRGRGFSPTILAGKDTLSGMLYVGIDFPRRKSDFK